MKKLDGYERVGNDLIIRGVKISLKDSLTGTKFPFSLFNKESIILDFTNHIIRPGDFVKFPGKGFYDLNEQKTKRGDLIIYFDVEFPKILTEKQKNIIKLALDGRMSKVLIRENCVENLRKNPKNVVIEGNKENKNEIIKESNNNNSRDNIREFSRNVSKEDNKNSRNYRREIKDENNKENKYNITSNNNINNNNNNIINSNNEANKENKENKDYNKPGIFGLNCNFMRINNFKKMRQNKLNSRSGSNNNNNNSNSNNSINSSFSGNSGTLTKINQIKNINKTKNNIGFSAFGSQNVCNLNNSMHVNISKIGLFKNKRKKYGLNLH